MKKISREEEEELKPTEEKIVHRQKARLAVRDDAGWEERGRGEVKVIKDLRTGKVRLEMRGAQYGEVCLSQPLSPEVLDSSIRTRERILSQPNRGTRGTCLYGLLGCVAGVLQSGFS